MSMITKNQTWLFFFTSLFFIFSLFFKPYSLSWMTKLLPMAILIFIAISQCKDTTGKIFIAHVCYLIVLKPIEKKN